MVRDGVDLTFGKQGTSLLDPILVDPGQASLHRRSSATTTLRQELSVGDQFADKYLVGRVAPAPDLMVPPDGRPAATGGVVS
jgi:hypothetical protein